MNRIIFKAEVIIDKESKRDIYMKQQVNYQLL